MNESVSLALRFEQKTMPTCDRSDESDQTSTSVADRNEYRQQPQGSDRARLLALKHAGAIFGVDAPKKVAPTNPAGDKPYRPTTIAIKNMSVEELRVLKKLRDRMRAIASGKEDGKN